MYVSHRHFGPPHELIWIVFVFVQDLKEVLLEIRHLLPMLGEPVDHVHELAVLPVGQALPWGQAVGSRELLSQFHGVFGSHELRSGEHVRGGMLWALSHFTDAMPFRGGLPVEFEQGALGIDCREFLRPMACLHRHVHRPIST